MKLIKDKNSKFVYSMSLAASWAWGTSLVVGMELIQTKGYLPFLIWAIANSLAIPLFGFLAYKIPNLKKIIESKIVAIFMIIVSIFCLWIQLNAIYQYLGNLSIFSDIIIKAICILIMISLTLFLYKDGLIKSIFLDNPLWYVCYLILFILVIYGVLSDIELYNIKYLNNKSEILWALNSCFILFSGPFMSLQNWQMAEKLKMENKMSSHYIAGLLFALYMILVAVLAHFKFDGVMNILLVLVVICVAFSTADAAIVGMQKLSGKKIGTLISIVSIIAWLFVIPLGVMGLWTTMGNMRKYVVLICIIASFVTYFYAKKVKVNKHE